MGQGQSKWLKRNDALQRVEEDKLFREYLEYVKNIILSIEPPFVLGVLGEWGRGKTTLFNFLQEELKNDFKMVYFESLKYEKTGNLSLAFVKKILKELEVEEHKIRKFLKKIAGAFQIGINLWIINIQGNFEKIFNKQYDSIETLRNDFEAFLEGIEDNILVFIDDLDRCIPEFALEFLENIRYFFSVKKIIFVVALDEKVIEIALQKRYGPGASIHPRAYLEKFIDLFIKLPNYKVDNIKEYMKFLIEEKYRIPEEVDPENKRVWEEIVKLAGKIPDLQKSSLLTNPRKIDRIIKTMIFLIRTAPRNSILLKSYPLLFLMLVLREYYPEIFRMVRDNESGPVNVLLQRYGMEKKAEGRKHPDESSMSIGRIEETLQKLETPVLEFWKDQEGKNLGKTIIKVILEEVKRRPLMESQNDPSVILHKLAEEIAKYVVV